MTRWGGFGRKAILVFLPYDFLWLRVVIVGRNCGEQWQRNEEPGEDNLSNVGNNKR